MVRRFNRVKPHFHKEGILKEMCGLSKEKNDAPQKGAPSPLPSEAASPRHGKEVMEAEKEVKPAEPEKPESKAPTAQGAEREDLALLRVMISIMEDVAKTVLRLEKLLNDRVSMLERRLEEIKDELAERIEGVELKGVARLEETLEKTVSNLQKGMEILTLNDLVKKVEDLAVQVREGKAVRPERGAVREERREEPVPPVVARRGTRREARAPGRPPAPAYEEPREEEEERLIRPSDLFRRGY